MILQSKHLPCTDKNEKALISHLIRKKQGTSKRDKLVLREDFFELLKQQRLPTPAEACDNMIEWIARKVDERPGTEIEDFLSNKDLVSAIGVLNDEEAAWIIDTLVDQGFLHGKWKEPQDMHIYYGCLTAMGWQRYEEIKTAKIAEKYAFFARQFENPELNAVFENCLAPAIRSTGFELRTVQQSAGLIDAIIESDIRRCRFVIADLSDGNNGAYWESGFAEGLGKPVIYICNAEKADKTHFDTNHRQTIRWSTDPKTFTDTAKKLKAVICNTIPEAIWTDE